MIQPDDLSIERPMTIANDVITSTTKVWGILKASYDGDLEVVKGFVSECPEMAYAQYNYTPPIHFAVREGHAELAEYLLFECGAHDPPYKIYPFLDTLDTLASDRGFAEIGEMLQRYAGNKSLQKFAGDNGAIDYQRSEQQIAFQKMVNRVDIQAVELTLSEHPHWARDNTYFWGEGILCMPAKGNHRELMRLLMSYGAKVPRVLKWAPAYYFERYDSAEFLMENGMDPNTLSWQGVTLLHDMAQKNDVEKAKLLIDHGAELDPIDDEYLSTPLGMAARWGNREMVELLIDAGADIHKSGAEWSTPLAWAESKGHEEIVKLLQRAYE
jgi:uncharacterized protein